MKKLSAVLYFIIIVAILGYGWRALDRKLRQNALAISEIDAFQARLADSDVKMVFVLTDDNMLTFELPETQFLKLVSRANVTRLMLASATPVDANRNINSFSYALRYRLYSARGTLLTENVYHHRTRISFIKSDLSEWLSTSSFYVPETLIPANAEAFLIGLQPFAEIPHKLTIQLGEHDSTIADVSLGLNYQNRLPAHKLRYTWQRLSEDEKAEIARGNVFPQFLLREEEIRNALTNYWSLLVPTGVEGIDFTRRKLYVQRHAQSLAMTRPLNLSKGSLSKNQPYLENETLPDGFYIDNWFHGVAEIPAPGGSVRFEFTPGSSPSPAPVEGEPVEGPLSSSPAQNPLASKQNTTSQIHITWYGTNQTPQTFQILVQDTTFSETLNLPAGFIEIKALAPELCRRVSLFLLGENVEREITPEPVYVRTYLTGVNPLTGRLQSDSTVTFHMAHFDNKETPFRFDVRQIKQYKPHPEPTPSDSLTPYRRTAETPPPEPVEGELAEGRRPEPAEGPVHITYEMLMADGSVWKTGMISTDTLLSHYDRLTNVWASFEHSRRADWLVTEPRSYHINIPARVCRIRFFSSQPALITAYNRPPELAKKTRIQQAELLSPPETTVSRSWFPLLPEDYDSLVRYLRSPVLITQPFPYQKGGPGVGHEDVTATAQFQWESLTLPNNWPTRTLFIPADTTTFPQADGVTGSTVAKYDGPAALATIYRPIVPEQEFPYDFSSPDGAERVSPRLIFLNEDLKPFSMSIKVDGHDHFQTTVAGLNGEVWLPPIRIGRHTFVVTTSKPVRLYLNNVRPILEKNIARLAYPPADTLEMTKRSAYRLTKKVYAFVYEKQQPEERISFRWFAGPETAGPLRVHVQIIPPAQKSVAPGDFLVINHNITILNREFDIEPLNVGKYCVLGAQDEYVDAGRAFSIPLRSDLPAGNYRIVMTMQPGAAGYFTLARLTTAQQVTPQFFTGRNESD